MFVEMQPNLSRQIPTLNLITPMTDVAIGGILLIASIIFFFIGVFYLLRCSLKVFIALFCFLASWALFQQVTYIVDEISKKVIYI